jgi:hypothetical protein
MSHKSSINNLRKDKFLTKALNQREKDKKFSL